MPVRFKELRPMTTCSLADAQESLVDRRGACA